MLGSAAISCSSTVGQGYSSRPPATTHSQGCDCPRQGGGKRRQAVRPPISKTRNKTTLRVAFSKSTQQVLPPQHTPLESVCWVTLYSWILWNPIVRSHVWAHERRPGHRGLISECPTYQLCVSSLSSYCQLARRLCVQVKNRTNKNLLNINKLNKYLQPYSKRSNSSHPARPWLQWHFWTTEGSILLWEGMSWP